MNDYKAYEAGGNASHVKKDSVPILNVDVKVVDIGDRPRWERLFLRSYLIYRPLSGGELKDLAKATGSELDRQGGLGFKRQQAASLMTLIKYSPEEKKKFTKRLRERLQQVEDVLNINWKKFTQDKDTICVIATPQKGQDVPSSVVVGLTYITRSYDAKLGLHIGKMEGTYVPSDYRDRQVGRQVIEAAAKYAHDRLGIQELQFWSHEKNPNTPRLYRLLQSPVDERAKSVRTKEDIYVVGLNRGASEQYSSQFQVAQKKTSNSKFKTVEITAADMANEPLKNAFVTLYKAYLDENGYKVTAEKVEHMWQEITNPQTQTRGFLYRNKNQALGVAIAHEGVKMPRDAFLTSDISCFYLHPGTEGDDGFRLKRHVGGFAGKVIERLMDINPKTAAVRCTMNANDPQAKVFPQAVMDIGRGIKVKPVRLPFMTFRMPMTKEMELSAPLHESMNIAVHRDGGKKA